MRKTHSTIQVMAVLMDDPTGKHWGYDLSRRSGVRSGVLYPILRRMLEEGWLDDGWEDPPQTGKRRPPRRYYKLTGEGEANIGAILREAQSDTRFGALIGKLA